MIPGFNHSVKHRGTVYHVQTEDSGLQNPLVSTHLFLGGNVLASRRTSYAELVGSADAESQVRRIMQEQHKEMLRQLIRGAFDGKGAAAAQSAYQPGQLAAPRAAAAAISAARPAPAPPRTVAPPVTPPAAAPVPQRSPTASAQRAAAPPRTLPPAEEPPVLSRSPRNAPPQPVLIPEIDDEDLLSDRRLDEVILAYLAEPGLKRG